jgi:indolepyruvate ferredoxin oxidoreductase beta subunit
MPKVTNILMVGVGGQGIVLASDILAEAALVQGFDVKKSEIHGMSQRGGSVFSHVRFGDRIHSPLIPEGRAHAVYSLETMELLRFADYAAKEAHAVYLTEQILPSSVDVYPEGLEQKIAERFGSVVRVDKKILIARLDNPKTLNIATLGALSNLVQIEPSAFTTAIDRLVPRGTEQVNCRAFEIGQACRGS